MTSLLCAIEYFSVENSTMNDNACAQGCLERTAEFSKYHQSLLESDRVAYVIVPGMEAVYHYKSKSGLRFSQ